MEGKDELDYDEKSLLQKILEDRKALNYVVGRGRYWLEKESVVLEAVIYLTNANQKPSFDTIVKLCPYAKSKTFEALKFLEEAELISREGPRKGGSWKAALEAWEVWKFISDVNHFLILGEGSYPSVRNYLKEAVRLYLNEVANHPNQPVVVAFDSGRISIPCRLEYDPQKTRLHPKLIEKLRSRFAFIEQRAECPQCGYGLLYTKKEREREGFKKNLPRCPMCSSKSKQKTKKIRRSL